MDTSRWSHGLAVDVLTRASTLLIMFCLLHVKITVSHLDMTLLRLTSNLFKSRVSDPFATKQVKSYWHFKDIRCALSRVYSKVSTAIWYFPPTHQRENKKWLDSFFDLLGNYMKCKLATCLMVVNKFES